MPEFHHLQKAIHRIVEKGQEQNNHTVITWPDNSLSVKLRLQQQYLSVSSRVHRPFFISENFTPPN